MRVRPDDLLPCLCETRHGEIGLMMTSKHPWRGRRHRIVGRALEILAAAVLARLGIDASFIDRPDLAPHIVEGRTATAEAG